MEYKGYIIDQGSEGFFRTKTVYRIYCGEIFVDGVGSYEYPVMQTDTIGDAKSFIDMHPLKKTKGRVSSLSMALKGAVSYNKKQKNRSIYYNGSL